MLSIVLSLDSIFAGAAFRLFGGTEGRKYWAFEANVIGLADSSALLSGRVLHRLISTDISPAQLGVLFACCALVTMILGGACALYPRRAIVSMALLFSIDNFLVGAELPSLMSAIHLTPYAAISSGLGCLAGIQVAESIASRVNRRLSFALGSLAVAICFFVV